MDPAQNLPGQRKVSIDQAFKLALEHHAAGRRPQAEALARQVVQLAPGHAFGWQLLAVLAHEAGQTAQAIQLMGKAIQALPLVGSFYANRGEMHRLVGDLPKAIADGEQAVKLEPRSAAAYGNLGVALYQSGEIDKAEAAQKQALRCDANHLQALNNLGSILRDRKDREGAAAMYRKALAVNPNYTEARNNLGAVLIELEDPEGALRELVQVVRQSPRYAEAHCNIGNAFSALEDFVKAEAAYKNAMALKPEYPEAMEGLARCAQESRDLPRAEMLVRQAIALKPERSSAWTLLGSIQSEQAFPDKSIETYRHALSLDPANAGALIGLGHVEMEQGHMDVAEDAFRQALAIKPDNIAPRLSLTQVRKTREGDADFAALEAAAKDIDKVPESRALAMHFALGKGYEDLKRYDEAFPHFLEGCRLKRKRVEYSADNTDLIGDNIRKTFTREFVDSLRGAGDPSDTPIFVLGMPRSGTTLTETIIASHPDVYGAGELPDLLHIASRGPKGDDQGYPLNLDGVTREQLTAMGRQYVSQVRERAPSARHITDKMPANFNAVGLIHLMLPNAKIVHIKRNAVDTCVSGFTKLFHRSQHQSYDLRELGRYYRNYLKVMAHWREVLPPGSFYEIQYEQLVANQEEESRKLIAYCGLEWNDACLSPDKTERNVKTASVTQVRQPVYTSSVERWRVYEKFLGPLLEELGDAARG